MGDKNFAQLITSLIVIVISAGIMSFTWTNDDATRSTLNAAGFKDIKVGGHAWFQCGNDTYSTEFSATNTNGQHIEGAVCCGLLKRCTVRF
jgi:hypothetical protein